MSHWMQSTDGNPPGSELQDRVKRAQREYEEVLEEVGKLIEHTRHLDPASPDATTTVRNAKRIQDDATREYLDALQALSEFVLGRRDKNCS